MKPLIAVVGGMGPLASAAFLDTVYRENVISSDQNAPRILLDSDPNVPDRSEAIATGRTSDLVKHLEASLVSFNQWKPSAKIICCFSSHAVVGQLSPEARAGLVSLTDLACDIVADEEDPMLLLCTKGSVKANIFERVISSGRVMLPSKEHQDEVHELIYRIKSKQPAKETALEISHICKSYGVSRFFAGCTELHLVSRYLKYERMHNLMAVDPLMHFAAKGVV